MRQIISAEACSRNNPPPALKGHMRVAVAPDGPPVMPPCVTTAFGGTGFLSRRIVRHLHQHGFAVQIASRHVRRERFGIRDPRLVSIETDIHNEQGNGSTKLQPVDVADVAEAIARLLQLARITADTFECGGPRVYSYRELSQAIASEAGLKLFLFPVPFNRWHALAQAAEFYPPRPVTRNQVELMRADDVASPLLPGLAELGITPQAIQPTSPAPRERCRFAGVDLRGRGSP